MAQSNPILRGCRAAVQVPSIDHTDGWKIEGLLSEVGGVEERWAPEAFIWSNKLLGDGRQSGSDGNVSGGARDTGMRSSPPPFLDHCDIIS